MEKIKVFFAAARINFKAVSGISAVLLLFGQRLILGVLVLAAADLLHTYTAGELSALLESARETRALIENSLLALLLLWSGAWMIDYLHKHEGKSR